MISLITITNLESNPLVFDSRVPKNFLIAIGFGFAVLISCCFLNYSVAGIISAITLIFVLIVLFRYKPLFIIKYLSFVFGWAGSIAGCFVIEYFNVYLTELNVISFNASSLSLLCLSCAVFFLLLVLFDLKFEIKEVNSPTLNNKYGLAFYGSVAILILLCIMFAMVITKPSFILGLDRFEYELKYPLGVFAAFANYMNWLIVIPLLAIRNGNKVLGCACVVVYCLFLLWTGTKFGGFFTILCLIPLVYYDRFKQLNPDRLRLLVSKFGIALICLIIIAVGSYTLISDKTGNEYFQERVAQQGQLWWRTYSLSNGETHLFELKDELDATANPIPNVSDNVGSKYGIYKIMYYCAPESYVDNKLMSGSRYSEAGYAAAYYYAGFWGPIIYATLMALLISAFTNLFIKTVTARSVIFSLLSIRLLKILSTVSSMFIFSELIEPVSLLSYFLLCLWLAKKSKVNYRNRISKTVFG